MSVENAGEQRVDIHSVDPDAYKAVLALEKYVHSRDLDKTVLELVKIRASQINRCAWCLDMHTADARKLGIPRRKLDLIAAWGEAGPLFTGPEKAALALTEQVTLISQNGVSDDVWTAVRAHYNEREAVTLLMAITAINVWNRMNVAARTALPPEQGKSW